MKLQYAGENQYRVFTFEEFVEKELNLMSKDKTPMIFTKNTIKVNTDNDLIHKHIKRINNSIKETLSKYGLGKEVFETTISKIMHLNTEYPDKLSSKELKYNFLKKLNLGKEIITYIEGDPTTQLIVDATDFKQLRNNLSEYEFLTEYTEKTIETYSSRIYPSAIDTELSNSKLINFRLVVSEGHTDLLQRYINYVDYLVAKYGGQVIYSGNSLKQLDICFSFSEEVYSKIEDKYNIDNSFVAIYQIYTTIMNKTEKSDLEFAVRYNVYSGKDGELIKENLHFK